MKERRVTELSIFGSKFLVKEALIRSIPMSSFNLIKYLWKHKYFRLILRIVLAKTDRPFKSYDAHQEMILDALFRADGASTSKNEDEDSRSFDKALLFLREKMNFRKDEIDLMTRSQLCDVINLYIDMHNLKGAKETNEKKQRDMLSRFYKKKIKEGSNKEA